MDIWIGFLIYEICVGIGLILLPFYYEWSMRRAFRIPDDKIWMHSEMTARDFINELQVKIEQGYIDEKYLKWIEVK